MLPHYLWKIKVQICDKLRTRSTFRRSVMVSVGISKLGLIKRPHLIIHHCACIVESARYFFVYVCVTDVKPEPLSVFV